jgi:hypothetical protein
LSAENEQLNAQLGSVLDRQTQIDALRQEIGMLAAPMATYSPKLTLFHVVHETLAGRAIISRMSVAANRVELRGTAEQASAVLTALAAVAGIDNVQLTAPLTKDRRSGQDLFAISFMITGELYRNPSQDVGT